MRKKSLRILVCEDDKYFRIALKEVIEKHGLITEVGSEAEALDLLASHYYDIALIDMNIDGPRSGLNILKKSKEKGIHSIILSSQTDEMIIEEAYESRCDHFLAKRHYKEHLEPYLIQYKNNFFTNNLKDFFDQKFITTDKILQEHIRKIAGMSLKDKTILITGETGVGKSLIGELLHQQNYGEDTPFIHLNCSEIPENLIESELFGHEKGAFTGALHNKKGKFELANGGTLFLDEIATMPMIMQQKLLKAIDQKSFYPLGSDKPVKSDFTLITATCEDLFEKIHAGEFRKDLFFRISGVNLEIPPLRERKEDIPKLVEFFKKQSPRRFVIKTQALEAFKFYDWPGNTRELKKKIEILSSTNKGIITVEDIHFHNSKELQAWLTSGQQDFISQNGLRAFIRKIEEESIKSALERNNGKITQTIKDLGISSSAFYRIFENLEISTP